MREQYKDIEFIFDEESFKKAFLQVGSNTPVNLEAIENIEYEKYSEERFKQIEEMSSFHKLNQKLDFSKCDGKTNYDYIIKKYLKENT